MRVKLIRLVPILALLATHHAVAQVDCEDLLKNYNDFPEYVSLQPVIDTLVVYGDYENALYLLEQQKLYHPDHQTAKCDSLYYLLLDVQAESKSCGCDFPARNEWIAANGPEGADATSFYIDDNDGYWLGTGSSGGVYFSSDKGKNWEARNRGIGPWHIYAFIEIDKQLYIQVNSNEGSNDGDTRIYRYNNPKNAWDFIPGKYKWDEKSSEGEGVPIYFAIQKRNENIIKKQREVFNLNAYYGVQYSYKPGYHFLSRGIDAKYGMDEEDNYPELRVFGFKERDAKAASLNKNFPRDVFRLTNGNLVPDGKNSILLSKSGPYLVKKQKSISPLPINGLVATDVRQIVETGDKIFVLVNEADIWKFEGGEWTQIFNAYEHHIAMKDPISHTGYETRQLNLQKDGTILFSFCGRLWKMEADESTHEVKLDLSKIEARFTNPKVIVSSGGYDPSGTLYLLLDILDYKVKDNGISRIPYNDQFSVLVKVQNEELTIVSRKERRNEFLFNDKKGGLWYAGEDVLKRLDPNSRGNELTETWSLDWISKISFKENGDFICIAAGNVWSWSYAQQKFIKLIDKVPYLTSSISYDSNGAIYAGTGQKYSESCWGGPYSGESSGIYKWTGEKWIPIIGGPNVWTYALAPNSQYGLAVGTSGSGLQFVKTK